jgi:ribonuclease-3
MPEGDLTKMRSAIVRNDQLAVFARHLKLGDALRLGRGEFATGGSHRDGLLGSTFEAVIGALYLDSGLGSVEAFVSPLLEGVRESVLTKIHDPKSQLQEWAQAQKMNTPHYRTVTMTGPDHAKEFEVEVVIDERAVGKGIGASKHTAQRTAAANAMKNLGIG